DALGRVVAGFGNDGESGYEGCRVGRAVGTYLHGPLLPRNPWFADWILTQALAHRLGEQPVFEPLPDALEQQAHAVAAAPARTRGGRRWRAQGAPRSTAGSRGCQRLRKRAIGGWRTIPSRSTTSNSRWPRTAASCEVTASRDRPPRSPAKMMCTTCFAAK